MNWLPGFLTRHSAERDLAEEIRQHLAEKVDELVAAGMSRDEALHTARREFGNLTYVTEASHDLWGWTSLDRLSADLRYAFRQLRRSPSFTLAAILTLALGIGATTAVFSVVNAVLLRPLPFPEADRLVSVQLLDMRGGPHPDNVSYPTFFDFRKSSRVFTDLISYRDEQTTLTGVGLPLPLASEIVSWDLFPALGVHPVLGRGFLPEEERPGVRVAVLSYGLWKNQFGGDPSIVGKSVTLDSRAVLVVGVAPQSFNFPVGPRRVQLWTTLAMDASSATLQPLTEQRGARLIDLVARLKPGVSLAQAQAQLDTVAAALALEYPDQNKATPATIIRPELDRLVGDTRQPVLILLGAVSLLLLIACANTANLLLARTADREREFAVRLAIGAGSGRVIRQLLTENSLLSLLGGLVGVAVAWTAIHVGLRFPGESLPRLEGVMVDASVLAFSFLLALVTTALCSIPAALRILRADFGGSLKSGGRGATGTNDRLRGTLVVAQIAMSLVLLSGAGLLASAFLHLVERDPGFRPDHLLSFSISLPDAQYTRPRQVAFCTQLLKNLAAAPGVISAGGGSPLPLAGSQMTISFNIQERPSPPSERPSANVAIVTPAYFQTLGTPLLQGRRFTERDDSSAPPVLIVNQAFANKFFPGENVVGKRIESGASYEHGTRMAEIIGVVGNARQAALALEPDPIYYFPYRQLPWFPPSILLRTAVPPLSLEPTLRRAVAALDPQVPAYEVALMEDALFSSVAGPRFHLLLLGSFAVIALLLTAIGLYGVLAYAVLRRTREIGVRMALGADRRTILAMVLSRAMRLVAVAVPIGLAGALAAGRILKAMLYGVDSRQPLLLAAACLLVALTAALAAWLPARRAASIDPLEALRSE